VHPRRPELRDDQVRLRDLAATDVEALVDATSDSGRNVAGAGGSENPRSVRELWKFCGSSGSQWEHAARVVRGMRADGEEVDWWAAGARRTPG
jgi:hypothetical protein